MEVQKIIFQADNDLITIKKINHVAFLTSEVLNVLLSYFIHLIRLKIISVEKKRNKLSNFNENKKYKRKGHKNIYLILTSYIIF